MILLARTIFSALSYVTSLVSFKRLLLRLIDLETLIHPTQQILKGFLLMTFLFWLSWRSLSEEVERDALNTVGCCLFLMLYFRVSFWFRSRLSFLFAFVLRVSEGSKGAR